MRRSWLFLTLAAPALALILAAAPVSAVAGSGACPNEANRAGPSGLLPDCRAYEQVSPADKGGNQAGLVGIPRYAWATADGQGILYATSGPMGIVHRGSQNYAIGRRAATGWSSESAAPRGSQEPIQVMGYRQYLALPSADLSKLVFAAIGPYVPANPVSLNFSWALYLTRSADESIDWLTQPQIADPSPPPGSIDPYAFQVAGASPDLGSVYFTGQPTLLTEDGERGPESWGLYEYSNGRLRSAGVLPDGALDPLGATPANTTNGSNRTVFGFTFSPEEVGNQVSADGSTMYFLSPDPAAQEAGGPPPQLYVRRDGASRLVSHSQASGQEAPSGAIPAPRVVQGGTANTAGQYVYGAADGSLAYFRSADALTAAAPDDGAAKVYRYDVASGSVEYLPGVEGTIAAASDDGQRFLFGNAQQISVWDHGAVLPVSETAGSSQLAPAKATPSGSEFVFSTTTPIPGFNGGGQTQVYRFDVATGGTICVSCPPAGVAATGPAEMSSRPEGGEVRANRGFSEDGSRVFFASPDPLLVRDTNGKRDVYEWSAGGGLSLITSGRSQSDSVFLDSGASGDDVFFATAEGLVPGDTDGAYDVYDARVGGGFATDSLPECAGEGCQGDPAATPLLPAPASISLLGRGNRRHPSHGAKIKVGAGKLVNGRLVLKLVLPGGGRVSAEGSGLRTRRRTYSDAGTYALAVPLRAGAKRALGDGHRLRLEVHLRFWPQSGKPSSTELVLSVKA